MCKNNCDTCGVAEAMSFFDFLEIMTTKLTILKEAREALGETRKLAIDDDAEADMLALHRIIACAASNVMAETLVGLDELDQAIDETEDA